eukprot:1139285-Pelagomonas_calceolata.AAC.6
MHGGFTGDGSPPWSYRLTLEEVRSHIKAPLENLQEGSYVQVRSCLVTPHAHVMLAMRRRTQGGLLLTHSLGQVSPGQPSERSFGTAVLHAVCMQLRNCRPSFGTAVLHAAQPGMSQPSTCPSQAFVISLSCSAHTISARVCVLWPQVLVDSREDLDADKEVQNGVNNIVVSNTAQSRVLLASNQQEGWTTSGPGD